MEFRVAPGHPRDSYRESLLLGRRATHIREAHSWAQAQREIPCFGTTHADYFHGPIPVTKPLTPAQVRADYEANTGHAIVRRFAKLDPLHQPAVLVQATPHSAGAQRQTEAAHVAVIVEEIAAMASQTLAANPKARSISSHLHEKHFRRKHGRDAYYGRISSRCTRAVD